MPTAQLSERDLRRELTEFRDRYPRLGDDELFVLWFLRAFITESEQSAATALSGGSRDKGVDAVFIDDAARVVFIVQGKYRQKVSAKAEGRADVLGFAHLAAQICGNAADFACVAQGLSPEVLQRLEAGRERIRRRGYSIQLLYVTLGSCSASLRDEAARLVRKADASSSFQLFDGGSVLLLLRDYLDGVAPPVPSLDLEIEAGGGVRTGGVFNRYDKKTEIESWVFAMTGAGIAGIFSRAGTRLFARNVRGFLGSTEINRGMETTIAKEPEYFWYYNNGITIVCDDAKLESGGGREMLRVTNPQVINGQQTTRALARSAAKAAKASVLVRVIRVPRHGGGNSDHFESLVSQIVGATNWQNAIRPSDLMSNDRRQIEIERQFRKLNYLYLRKRTTKGEARRASGGRHQTLVKKEEVAQAVAACDLDPAVVREGKERLFEERWYGSIFPTADANYYLSRYWLMRQVSYAARGFPERAYAKWVVLHFAWTALEPVCRSRPRAEAFRRACERNRGEVLNPMIRALDLTYGAVLRFYRAKRGAGKTAIDVSSFFKHRGLHEEFAKYWRGARNKARPAVSNQWKRFETALVGEEMVE